MRTEGTSYSVVEFVTEYTIDDIEDGEIYAEAERDQYDWDPSDGDPAEWAAAIIDDGAPGPVEPSCWPWRPGSWFTSARESIGMRGELEDRSWHLEGFSDDEQEAVWDIVRGAK